MDSNFRSLIDVKNDGYPDIVGIGNCTTGPSGSCVYISYNSGGKGFQGYSTFNGNPSINVNPVFTTLSGTLWGIDAPIFVTDVDSDGFVDLFGFGANKMYDSKGLSNFFKGFWPTIETREFQREKKQAYSIFHGEFKSSAKTIQVLREGGQNHKKHLEVQYFR